MSLLPLRESWPPCYLFPFEGLKVSATRRVTPDLKDWSFVGVVSYVKARRGGSAMVINEVLVDHK